MEVVSKIFKYRDLLIRDDIDLLSKGVVATKVSIKGVDFGGEGFADMSFLKNHVLLIIAIAP